MQTYTRITNEFTGVELPGKIDENLQSLKSHFSGTAFPTENLVVGMLCYRTDEKKVYRLMEDLATWKLESDLNYANGVPIATQSEAEKGEDDTKSMTPLKVKQSILRNVPTPETMIGASDTSDGLEGFVPAPKAGDNKKVLHGDGLWKKAIGFESYWEANEVVKVGDIRFPYGRENSGYVMECIEGGTTGSTQPEIITETNEIANYSDLGRVGQVRVIFNLAEKDVDEVMAMGVTYSRLTYPELWEWAGKRAGLIISEEEWQAKFAETNGKFVPYYSSGDGSSTFRTPLLGAYLKGAESGADIGKWLDAGLPNIGASIGGYGDRTGFSGLQGAFYGTQWQSNIPLVGEQVPGHGTYLFAEFDASLSNPTYGNSDTVTPETMTGVWVIKAVGVVVDSGETDIAQVLTATEQVQERVSAVEDELPKKANLGALSMPSNTGVNVNVDVGVYWSIYQAPADGWLYIRCADGLVVVRNADNDARLDDAIGSAGEAIVLFPASKGTNLQIYASITPTSARFFYAQSEV